MSVRLNCQEMLKGCLCSTYKFWPFWLKYVPTFCNFLDFPRTGFWILLYSFVPVGLWLKPSGARLVWSSFNEGSDKGNDERALMRLNPWLESALGLLYLVTLATDPLSLLRSCHALLSLDLGRCVYPIRFSSIFGIPMVQTLLCSNLEWSWYELGPRCEKSVMTMIWWHLFRKARFE